MFCGNLLWCWCFGLLVCRLLLGLVGRLCGCVLLVVLGVVVWVCWYLCSGVRCSVRDSYGVVVFVFCLVSVCRLW